MDAGTLTLFLEDCPGRYLMARCARCRRQELYVTDELQITVGNHQLRGLKTTFAQLWHCERLLESGWRACRLAISLEGRVNAATGVTVIPNVLRRFGAAPAPTAMRLGDLKSWHILYGVCDCGHAGYIDHKRLTARYGENTPLGEITSHLRCRRSPKHRDLIFALGQSSR